MKTDIPQWALNWYILDDELIDISKRVRGEKFKDFENYRCMLGQIVAEYLKLGEEK